MTSPDLKPMQRVRIEQAIHTREGEWVTTAEGEVVSFEARPTGSWFAHGKNNRLWLPRLRIKKDDGELADLVVDRGTRVTILKPAP